jgi:D-glycero-D-manno-heptose 1,7-bisphosphate phosphatase
LKPLDSPLPDRRRAVFVDRDGTLNLEREYLCDPAEFRFFPGVPQAIRRLREAGFLVIVVTNQSGVARGYFTLAEVDSLHAHIQSLLAAQGTTLDAFYVCPHHPQGVPPFRKTCSCRKGEPGMLLQAARDFHIDLARSFMIGDKASDLEAGEKAGCSSLLVLTGYGKETAQSLAPLKVVPMFADLPRAADHILATC